jgi:hypothetical protein
MAKLQSSTIVERKALEEFDGGMKMERRPEGSVDSFRSSQNRSRWQYASAGKVVPKLILSALECMTHFEITTEPPSEAATVAEE